MPPARGADGRFLPKGTTAPPPDPSGKSYVLDSGWAMKVSHQMAKLDGLSIRVGWFDPTNAMKAFINEFGSKHVPSRPFIRTAFDHHVDKYAKMIGRALGTALAGTPIGARLLWPAAVEARNDFIKSIARGGWRPNKPKTLKHKTGTTPLVNTGEMQRSIAIKAGGK